MSSNKSFLSSSLNKLIVFASIVLAIVLVMSWMLINQTRNPGSQFSSGTITPTGNTKVWRGPATAGGSFNWNIPDNWVGGVAPVDGDDLVFSDENLLYKPASGPYISKVSIPYIINSIKVNTNNKFIIDNFGNSGKLSIQGGITQTGGKYGVGFNVPTTVIANQTFEVQDQLGFTMLKLDADITFTDMDNSVSATFGSTQDDAGYGLSGTGKVIIDAKHMNATAFLSGTHTGTIEVKKGTLSISTYDTYPNFPTNVVVTGPETFVSWTQATINSYKINDGVSSYASPGSSYLINGIRKSSYGKGTITGDLTLNGSSQYIHDIFTSGAMGGNYREYDKLTVDGAVNLNNAKLAVNYLYEGSTPPQLGEKYLAINKTSAGPINGTFAGIAEGGKVATIAYGWEFTVSYKAGDGNDLELTVSKVGTLPPVGQDTTPTTSQNTPLVMHRFWSTPKQTHFYTISETEKSNIIANDPSWSYDGTAFKAYSKTDCEGRNTVYRFWHEKNKRHFYTINEAEVAALVNGNPNWKLEGSAYCAYKTQVEGSTPLYRFWSAAKQAHFYTISEAEKNNILANDKSWALDGVAFYVMPKN